ncbi:galactosyltransferase-related protein [Paenibacillus sp. XY044]|uniref:galactosyltransferase-related protein n=1 Tax=Paenibacillus sp. XY044 TaxID=2026089 RepID=UPI000B97E7DF|nr:galactosyltransferase-related protein [Paenibacillus sp. XY044]OZB98372.1 hypothetical protein CJP46_04240 [Paenibacillus sp. XY044]
MHDDLSILIPYQPDGGPRDEALSFVLRFYRHILPAADICIGEIGTGEPFSRSRAINRAASRASGSIFIIADGDIIYDPQLVFDSVRLIEQGRWVIPFSRINRLTQQTSRKVIEGEAIWPLAAELDTGEEHAAYFVGGLNMVGREAFERTGGYDERFIGWGGEDEAFAYTMDTFVGEHVRLDGLMLHFWHPFVGPQGNPHYEHNYRLFERYKAARGEWESMHELIREKQAGKL